MAHNVDWKGVFPAPVTHFNDDMSINMPATMGHLEVMLDAGVHGLVMLGTCGENNSLEPEEKIEILDATVKLVKGRVPVLTGVCELTTARAVKFVKKVKEIGVDGLMVLPAMAYRADDREAIAHMRSIAQATDLPIIVYNCPPAYHVDFTVEMLQELVNEPTIEAVKEATGDVRRITDIINAFGDRYKIMSGLDDVALESVMLGAVGWISGLVSAFPHENRALWDFAVEKKWEEALDVYRWYMPLLHFDFHPKLVQYIKLAVSECGYGTETVRPPRYPLVGEERQKILDIINKAKTTRPEVVASPA